MTEERTKTSGVRDILSLRAEDEDDLAVISACLQDGLVTFGDMEYLREEERFVVVVNRFRWERADRAGRTKPFERVLTGLAVEEVKGVRLRNLNRRDRSRVLELLAIRPEAGHIDLLFAERGRVRLEVGRILCHLRDLEEPWPTAWRPQHPDTDEE